MPSLQWPVFFLSCCQGSEASLAIKETRASPGHEAKMDPRVELGTVGLKVNCHVRKFVSIANKMYSLWPKWASSQSSPALTLTAGTTKPKSSLPTLRAREGYVPHSVPKMVFNIKLMLACCCSLSCSLEMWRQTPKFRQKNSSDSAWLSTTVCVYQDFLVTLVEMEAKVLLVAVDPVVTKEE